MRPKRTFKIFAVACFAFLVSSTVANGELLAVGGGHIVSIDEVTADARVIGPMYLVVYSMAMHPSGTVYIALENLVSNEVELATVDPATGATWRGPAIFREPSALAFSPDGILFAIENYGLDDRLRTVDTATGKSTVVGGTGLPGVAALAFGPGGTLYGWDGGDLSGAGGLGLVTIDPLTGLATDVNPAVGTPDRVTTLAFAADGTLYGALWDLVTVDANTGELTLVGRIEIPSFSVQGMVWVPEPCTAASLLSMAPTALLAYAWRHKRKRHR